ncbi:S8 family serine peptidase [Demequina subtropica]|uniref:S8 family serine peptidase n=1 Tax=Demequina subtropica TaxID=1638989 RepID=UPI000785DA72|nr:S8 family serine peptidase [Demequina subtropica]
MSTLHRGLATTAAALLLASCTSAPPSPTLVGLVDTGVSVDAPQLDGYAIEQEGGPPSGEHGTLVLSVLLGAAHDDAPLPPEDVRVASFDVGPDASADDLAEGIEAALDAGVDVISISMGCRRGSAALGAAVERADALGTPIVAAAGNVRFLAPDYPARYETVVAVGAFDGSGRPWDGSPSLGIDATAIGVDVASADREGAPRTVTGTSFAAARITREMVATMRDAAGA